MNGIKAEYIDHLGSDLTCVNAARVSMDKESDWDWYDEKGNFKENGVLSNKDKKLISYLAKHNHFTPFTHTAITLRETVPIFVARQRFKHTVGFTYNEVSRRYVDDDPEFFTPDVWRKRAENVKQGSSNETVEKITFQGICEEWEDDVDALYANFIDSAERLYNSMIIGGVAPEQARMVLPQSMLTSYYVTGSLSAFARAYKLRIDPHAQAEIRDLAVQWDEIISPLFPESWKALTNE